MGINLRRMKGENMSTKKKIVSVIMVALIIVLNVLILNYQSDYTADTKNVYVEVVPKTELAANLYYSNGDAYTEEQSQMAYVAVSEDETVDVTFEVPLDYKNIAIRTSQSINSNVVNDIYFNYYFIRISLLDIGSVLEGDDGSSVVSFMDNALQERINDVQHDFQSKMNIVFCVILDIAFIVLAKYMFQLMRLVKEVFDNRVMILRLGKNDFKTRFAGSYLGMFWAFVQPIVTILVYWFVFEVGFRSSPVDDFPFVLWLTAGMVPWFFFSEAWGAGTNSLIEYSYLVKKVVFNISTIPIVKIISALFIHLFFVAFMLFMYVINGYMPTIYWVQIIYYSFCLIALVIALSYLCSAIMVFFKDLSQIINVVLQIGIWLSCIMWSVDMLPERFRWIMYFNPIYYVVSGYRNALINEVWFWETPYQTMGFWIIVVVLMSVGFNVFNKLRVHFADVL